LQTGKLDLAKGDYDAAVAKFADAQKVKGIDPQAQYESLYFTALAHLLAKQADSAAASLGAVQKWVAENLKGDDLTSSPRLWGCWNIALTS